MAEQLDDPGSMLTLYRSVLALRHCDPALATDDFAWIDRTDRGALCFRRGTPASGEIDCLVNFGPEPLSIPGDHQVVLSSHPIHHNQVEPDGAVWLRPPTSR